MFATLHIDDEGEYWESKDRVRLEAHITSVNLMMAALRTTRPDLQGPVKLPTGSSST